MIRVETVFAVVARVSGRDLQGGGEGPTLRLTVSEPLQPLPQQQHQQMQISAISPIKNPKPARSPVSMSPDRNVLVDCKIKQGHQLKLHYSNFIDVFFIQII